MVFGSICGLVAVLVHSTVQLHESRGGGARRGTRRMAHMQSVMRLANANWKFQFWMIRCCSMLQKNVLALVARRLIFCVRSRRGRFVGGGGEGQMELREGVVVDVLFGRWVTVWELGGGSCERRGVLCGTDG